MAKSNSGSFVLELELVLDTHDRAVLKKKLNIARQIYNTCLGEALKRLHKVQNDKGYRELMKGPSSRERNKRLREIELMYGYSEYQLHEWAVGPRDHFHSAIGSLEAQKLATRAFQAVEKLHYRKAKRVNFVPAGELISVENKSNTTGLRWKDGRVIWGELKLDVRIKKDDHYAAEALTRRVKYIRIVPREIRGRQRFFVQFVLEGLPPSKNRPMGPADRRVGIDPGVSTMAIVAENYVELAELAPGIQKDERKLARIQRTMDRSRRATNPGNYSPNGMVRKGRKAWVYSNRYRKLAAKERDMHRKVAAKRKQAHERLANRILSVGLDARTEDMQYTALQRRAKETTTNKRNGKPRSKKRFGKTLSTRAPAQLLSILDRKLRYYGTSLKKIDTAAVKASQYDHTTCQYSKRELGERWAIIDGRKVQRDLYSAFLIANTTDSLNTIDTERANSWYASFLVQHDHEIDRIKQTGSATLQWYVA